jgi:hypothetical protein
MTVAGSLQVLRSGWHVAGVKFVSKLFVGSSLRDKELSPYNQSLFLAPKGLSLAA